MRRILLIGLLILCLSGCKSSSYRIERIMEFRSQLLQGSGCSFTAEIIADYAQHLCTFKVKCKSDAAGKMSFEVISPESIAGITGTLGAEGGNLTFDDHALLFSMMADGKISPISAPWVMVKALRSGYIQGCGEEAGGLKVHIDDSYNENSLQLVILTDMNNVPDSVEIFHRGNRVLTLCVEDFVIL